MQSALAEFRIAIGGVVALYHDSRVGYVLAEKRTLKVQQKMMGLMPDDQGANSIEALNERSYIHGMGEAWGANSKVRHQSTQGEFKERNREGGANHYLIGNLCVVAIYQYWEDEFRNAIATELGVPREDLKSPVFGDLRLLRNAILHNRALGTHDLEKCQLFFWFKEGDAIAIDEEKFDELAEAIQGYLQSLEAT